VHKLRHTGHHCVCGGTKDGSVIRVRAMARASVRIPISAQSAAHGDDHENRRQELLSASQVAHSALDAVQRLHSLKGGMHPRGQLLNCHQLLIGSELFGFQCRDVDLLEALQPQYGGLRPLNIQSTGITASQAVSAHIRCCVC
jgi:hypothetical protein